MAYKLNTSEEAFLKKLLSITNGSSQMQEVTPDTLLDDNGNKLLTEEQEKNFDSYIEALHSKGFISNLDNWQTFTDVTGRYSFSLVPDAFSYFEDKKNSIREQKREKRSERRHDLLMVLIGSLIGLIPFITTTVIPWIVSLFEK